MTPGEKALTLSYIHCKMLIENLEVVVHELKCKGEKYGQLNDKLCKLKAASRNAFGKIDQNLTEKDCIEKLTEDIEILLDHSWDKL